MMDTCREDDSMVRSLSVHQAAIEELGQCPYCGLTDAEEPPTDYDHPMVPGYGDRL